MMVNITPPTILDMAYLSAKIYEDPRDEKFFEINMKATHHSWYCLPSTMHREIGGVEGLGVRILENITHYELVGEKNIGLQMGIYVHPYLKCSVLVIRGTAGILNLLEDGMYTLNRMPALYERAIKCFLIFRSKNILKEFPLVACTGHSLGGIIAKMIAPVTGLSTYTFNSPGVVQFLTTNKNEIQKILESKDISRALKLHSAKDLLQIIGIKRGPVMGQEIMTYITNQDVVGNLRRDNDLGKDFTLQLKNEPLMPDSQVRIKNTPQNNDILTKTDINLISKINLSSMGPTDPHKIALIALYYMVEHSVNPELFERISTFIPGNESKKMMEYHSITSVVLSTLIDKYHEVSKSKCATRRKLCVRKEEITQT